MVIEDAPNLEPNEDCLTANVFRVQGTRSDAALPIMVYIHGGGELISFPSNQSPMLITCNSAFNRGTATMHDTASMLSHSAEPFLAISFNYRLGALGFLNSSFTAKHDLLNLGLRDQILLLDWVHTNAAAFGGNKDLITVVGISAGAHSIAHHTMNINEERHLFARAIIESGAATSRATHKYDSALHEAQFEKFVRLVGCSMDSPDLLADLRSAPASAIIDAQDKVFAEYNPSVRWAWQPVIDNDIISRSPIEAWKSNDYHSCLTITGFNHNEGTRYIPKTISTNAEFVDFFKTLLPQLTPSHLERLQVLYPDPDVFPEHVDKRDIAALGLGRHYARTEAAYGHYAYVSPVRYTAQHNGPCPTWLYHWNLQKDVISGANHGDNMWYEVMAPSARRVSPTHDAIARKYHNFLCRFIVHGDPGEEWQSFTESRKTMVFGEGNDEELGGTEKGTVAKMIDDEWGVEQCQFWEEVKELEEM